MFHNAITTRLDRRLWVGVGGRDSKTEMKGQQKKVCTLIPSSVGHFTKRVVLVLPSAPRTVYALYIKQLFEKQK